MNTFLMVSLGLTLVLTVFALVHQVRLRRALEKLLRLILYRWRSNEEQPNTPNSDSSRHGCNLNDQLY